MVLIDRYLIRKDKASMTTTLDIYPVQKEDQKYFVCQFRTGSGVATQVFKLTVKGKEPKPKSDYHLARLSKVLATLLQDDTAMIPESC